jgi:hypothetical protein
VNVPTQVPVSAAAAIAPANRFAERTGARPTAAMKKLAVKCTTTGL